MNLHQIVSGAVGTVNNFEQLSIQVSTGNSVGADGKQTPTYAAPVTAYGQVQPLQFRDIQQLDGLNLQGTRRKIYIDGHVYGLVRPANKGGDLITTPSGLVWLVAMVLEHWPAWTCCAVTLQNGS